MEETRRPEPRSGGGGGAGPGGRGARRGGGAERGWRRRPAGGRARVMAARSRCPAIPDWAQTRVRGFPQVPVRHPPLASQTCHPVAAADLPGLRGVPGMWAFKLGL